MDRNMNQGDYDRWLQRFSLLRAKQVDETLDRVDKQLVSHEELPALRSEITETADRIFKNWRNLESIVQRHEATIQRRWTSKSKLKRRNLLLTTWPNMAQDHRPDIVLFNRSSTVAKTKKEVDRLMEGGNPPVYKDSDREALLMPYINLHDLTKTEPLLLMIHARARRSPHTFARRDLQLSLHGFGFTKWRNVDGYIMDFDGRQPGPETYGELREGRKLPIALNVGVDPRIADGLICPGYGQWVLEIQDRLYKFLLDAVQTILHDIPPGDLTGPKYQIQPEPSLPSAKAREDGSISLAVIDLEATYSSPGRMDLHRLQSLLRARAHEEEDKLWDLREDPERFTTDLKALKAHRPEYVLDYSGKEHQTTTIDGFKRWYGGSDMKDLEDTFVVAFLRSNFIDMEFWGELVQGITGLIELKKQHFDSKNVQFSDPLPVEFAERLYQFQYNLFKAIEQRISTLLVAARSSPPMRPRMRRTSADTLDKFCLGSHKKPPQHIFDFIKILERIFDETLKNVGHIAGVQSLVDQYDKFIVNVPNAREAVSPFVAQQISDLALLSECLRQIHHFQPWASTWHEEMGKTHVRASIVAQFKEKVDRLLPLESYKPSVEVRSMAIEISKKPYPVHGKRTAENVVAMQDAEASLGRMWDTMLEEMKKCNALLSHSKDVEPVKHTKKKAPQATFHEGSGQPFGGSHDIDDTQKVQISAKENFKTKTRGTAAARPAAPPQVEAREEQESQSPAHIIRVDHRAFGVFRALFYMPSSTPPPGEVKWRDFVHAMRSTGFGMEQLYGSAWQFVPHDVDESRAAAATKSIMFHEPHPKTTISLWQAREFGRRLARAYD
ncbi:hypothetical protein Daus18300_012427 [Diaporthe australafricana]|uniref:Uncharacterized protein n=1 Tax=Diaporthe australafricana TaxID=127596 RepID=A0ABR3W319_9PEZI